MSEVVRTFDNKGLKLSSYLNAGFGTALCHSWGWLLANSPSGFGLCARLTTGALSPGLLKYHWSTHKDIEVLYYARSPDNKIISYYWCWPNCTTAADCWPQRTEYSCNKITTTWIHTSHKNWNVFFSNAIQSWINQWLYIKKKKVMNSVYGHYGRKSLSLL